MKTKKKSEPVSRSLGCMNTPDTGTRIMPTTALYDRHFVEALGVATNMSLSIYGGVDTLNVLIREICLEPELELELELPLIRENNVAQYRERQARINKVSVEQSREPILRDDEVYSQYYFGKTPTVF